MNSVRRPALIFLLIFIAVTCMFFMKMTIFRTSPFKDIEIARDVEITREWNEIDVEGRIKPRGDVTFLSVKLQALSHEFGNPGITASDGTIFNPEIKIVDDDGQEYQFTYMGAMGNKRTDYEHKTAAYNGNYTQLPDGKVYKKLLIKSAIPFKADAIYWTYSSAWFY